MARRTSAAPSGVGTAARVGSFSCRVRCGAQDQCCPGTIERALQEEMDADGRGRRRGEDVTVVEHVVEVGAELEGWS